MTKKRQPVGVLITDTHLKDGNEDIVLSVFEQAIAVCQNHSIDKIYHLGDWFTSRKSQSLSVLITTLKISDMISKAGLTIDVMPGNHDKTDLNSNSSFLDFFHSSTFNVINDFHRSNITGNIGVLWCPYYKVDVWKDKLEAECKKGFDDRKWVLFGHQAIDGAVNNDGSKVKNGLSKSKFKDFNAIFFGHYHNRSGNYIGSAYQANFGEDMEKGVTLLYSDCSTEHIQLEFPSYVKFIANTSDDKQYKSVVDKAMKFKQQNPGHTVRVEMIGDQEKIASIDKSVFAEMGLQVTSKFDDTKVSLDYEENEFKVFDNEMLKEEFEAFAQEEGLDVEEGLQIIEKSLADVVS